VTEKAQPKRTVADIPFLRLSCESDAVKHRRYLGDFDLSDEIFADYRSSCLPVAPFLADAQVEKTDKW